MAGEVSWLSTQHLYVLAPTMRDSWLYAAAAGRAAKVLRPLAPELAQTYETSAVRAFDWGEADYARKTSDRTLDKVADLWLAVDARFVAMDLQWSEIPRAALFAAAKAHLLYRQRGGTRTAGLPDFFIGAHAQVLGVPILTRDAGRYRTYFPTVPLITP
jgi:hypothetical protein